MASVSNTPTATANDNTGPAASTSSWGNVALAQGAPDAGAATANLSTTLSRTDSFYLKCTSFGFSIPTGSTINGILIEFYAKSSVANAAVDKSVKLVNSSGSYISTDKATNTPIDSNFSYIAYGGASDLWSTTWSVSDINSANFGVGYSVKRNSTNTTVSVDSVRMTIYYTPPAGGDVCLMVSD